MNPQTSIVGMSPPNNNNQNQSGFGWKSRSGAKATIHGKQERTGISMRTTMMIMVMCEKGCVYVFECSCLSVSAVCMFVFVFFCLFVCMFTERERLWPVGTVVVFLFQ